MESPYFVYLLRCADHSLYTGITTDYRRRLKEHQTQKRGAKYTASHTPLRLECVWRTDSRSRASQLEYHIKRLSHAQKEQLTRTPQSLSQLLGCRLDDCPCQEEVI